MKIGIIGAGAMGSGIAQVAATAACEVMLFDTQPEALEKSKTKLAKVMARLVEKGRLSQKKTDAIQAAIHYVDHLKTFASCDMVIEAIVENLEIKKQVFTTIESIVSDSCIIATNTSSLSVTSIAAALNRPERCIGIHFFNPAPLMKLVEIIPAIQTHQTVTAVAREIIDHWGKLTVLVKDTPGFIVNKVARPFYGESLRIYEEGIANIPTIDWALKTIGGFRMGPFELMDFLGNDINYTVTETVFKAFYYDPRYKPAFTQKRMAEAGYLGRKTGKGYYDYTEGVDQPAPKEDRALGQKIVDRVVTMLINEAADTLHLGIANTEDIDMAMTKGVNYPKGLLAWADEIEIGECVQRMDRLYDYYREDRYRCCPLLRRMEEKGETFF